MHSLNSKERKVAIFPKWESTTLQVASESHDMSYHIYDSIYITGGNRYLDGMASKHYYPLGDRMFKFHCIKKPPMELNECTWGDFANDYEEDLHYICPNGKVVTGLASMFNDFDRRWRFRCCKVTVFALCNLQKGFPKKAFIMPLLCFPFHSAKLFPCDLLNIWFKGSSSSCFPS